MSKIQVAFKGKKQKNKPSYKKKNEEHTGMVVSSSACNDTKCSHWLFHEAVSSHLPKCEFSVRAVQHNHPTATKPFPHF